MTVLVWDSRYYKAGVDRGVLYLLQSPEEPIGVPWNGLVEVVEAANGDSIVSKHLDGVNFLNVTPPKDFQATVSAFSAPREFSKHMGKPTVAPGVQVTKQPKPRFHFSYRVMTDYGYDIHLVYNCLATQLDSEDTTINDSPEPKTLAWTFDATPPLVSSVRPSAHYIVKSDVNPTKLAELEAILYGSESTDPTIPTATSLLSLFD